MTTKLINKNFRVYFLNHEYFAQEQFATFTEAVAYAKSKCFEASIYEGPSLTAFWGPIGGLKINLDRFSGRI